MASCWIITEGIAGTENQCLGVAEALGVEPTIKRITLRQPWKALSPYLGFEQSGSFSPAFAPPWPDLLIASGRKSIAASRYIKKASRGKTFTVQIQDPRISPRHFDLVAVPAHDPTRGDNVLVTTAAPNRITPKRLNDARGTFQNALSLLPTPRVAVMIGGNSRAHKMTAEATRKLCGQLLNLDAGLMVTASRRTGEENSAILSENLKGENIYFWDGQGENPYFAFLAFADYIIVTADSVSMLSEAATTGKPVYMIDLEGGTERFDRFHQGLIDKGIVRRFEGALESWTYEPVNDATLIADEIKKHVKI